MWNSEQAMRTAAKLLIWVFFLLIIDPVLIMMRSKFGVNIAPLAFYALLAAGLFIIAALMEHGIARLNGAKVFFAAFAALVITGAVMYRGENVGPDFGARLLAQSTRPSNIGYVLWPAVNLLACAALYLFARQQHYRRTITAAAFTALILQLATMEADLWWPALFGDANGRAGGIAQNANVAALLVTVLASFMLSARPGEVMNRFAPYAAMLAYGSSHRPRVHLKIQKLEQTSSRWSRRR
jgi:hypothetical protein